MSFILISFFLVRVRSSERVPFFVYITVRSSERASFFVLLSLGTGSVFYGADSVYVISITYVRQKNNYIFLHFAGFGFIMGLSLGYLGFWIWALKLGSCTVRLVAGSPQNTPLCISCVYGLAIGLAIFCL